MTRRSTLGILAAASLAAAMSAPALAASEPETDSPIAVDAIEGIDWVLQRMLLDGALVEPPDSILVTLLMQDGNASGNGGCNDYFASYERDGDAIAFSGIGSTEMYCVESSDWEAAYLSTLGEVTSAFSTGGPMVMTDASGEPVLEFAMSDTGPIPTDGIEGLDWQVDALVFPGESTPTPTPEGVGASITLDDGQATGNGGCNGFSATYALAGTELSFSEVVSTKMACADPAMTFENALFEQLGAVATWASDGGSVTLYDANGAALVRLSAQV